jgi:hypothetical protein
MCLIALTWEFLEHAWKHEYRQTQNIILGLLVVKYKSEQIIPWYLVMFTFLPFSSISSFVDVHIGVSTQIFSKDTCACFGWWICHRLLVWFAIQ